MSLVELIPLGKGRPIILDDTIVTNIGRSPKIGCADNKISRNHAQVSIKSDGTVWIKGIHPNPTFYKTKTNQIVSLTKDKEYQLFNNDQFGLLPDEYFYRVSIKSKDEETRDRSDQNPTVSSSTTPKSPIQDKETLTIENHAEENSESVSNPTPILPTSTSVNSPSATTHKEERNQAETTSSTLPVNKQTNSKESIYDDDTDDEQTTTTAGQTSTSNHIDAAANHSTTTAVSSSSSSVARSNKRERCPYGASCYRTNPIHRQQAIHPGDSDWNTDDEDEEENTKPVCAYGDECYRTNPDHFNEYDHPKKRSEEMNKKHKTVEYDDDDDDDDSDDDDSSDGFDNNDIEWKPKKKSRYLDDSDDVSTDSSDKELTKQEAERFLNSSTSKHHGHVVKKPRSEDDE